MILRNLISISCFFFLVSKFYACYWMNKEGEWISSSYYMSELPKWIVDFQTKNSAKSYLAKNWNFDKKFNYNLDSLSNFDGNGIIKSTPHGNSILADLGDRVEP